MADSWTHHAGTVLTGTTVNDCGRWGLDPEIDLVAPMNRLQFARE